MLAAPTQTQTAIMPPKIYINGFPKSGTHLAVRYVFGLGLQANNPGNNWLGTNPWKTKRHNLDTWGKQIIKLQNGEFVKGHTGYLQSIEALFVALSIGMLFIYRDLRDVAVSQMHHVLSNDDVRAKHPAKEYYQSLPNNEAILLAIIEGIKEYPGIHERWETYAPWLASKWALKLKYEEMRFNPYATANKVFDYAIQTAYHDAGIEGVMSNGGARAAAIKTMLKEAESTHLSPTFREGKRGGWREAFTPAVKQAFKERDNGWTVRLGYERNEDW